MKKLLVAVVILMGVSATTVKADNHIFFNNLVEADLTVKTMEGLKFRVTGTNLTEKSVVEVKDDAGNILYKEVVSSDDFAKVFDMASLPDGKYSVSLTTGAKTVVEPFEIQTEVKRVATTK